MQMNQAPELCQAKLEVLKKMKHFIYNIFFMAHTQFAC